MGATSLPYVVAAGIVVAIAAISMTASPDFLKTQVHTGYVLAPSAVQVIQGQTISVSYTGSTKNLQGPLIGLYELNETNIHNMKAFAGIPRDGAGTIQSFTIPQTIPDGLYVLRYVQQQNPTAPPLAEARITIGRSPTATPRPTPAYTIIPNPTPAPTIRPNPTPLPTIIPTPNPRVTPTLTPYPTPVPTIIRPTPTVIPQNYSITTNPSQVTQGDFITLTINAPAGANWVGVFRQGENNSRNHLDYGYYNGSTTTRYNTGKLEPGTYEFRLFQGYSYVQLAASRPVLILQREEPVADTTASEVPGTPRAQEAIPVANPLPALLPGYSIQAPAQVPLGTTFNVIGTVPAAPGNIYHRLCAGSSCTSPAAGGPRTIFTSFTASTYGSGQIFITLQRATNPQFSFATTASSKIVRIGSGSTSTPTPFPTPTPTPFPTPTILPTPPPGGGGTRVYHLSISPTALNHYGVATVTYDFQTPRASSPGVYRAYLALEQSIPTIPAYADWRFFDGFLFAGLPSSYDGSRASGTANTRPLPAGSLPATRGHASYFRPVVYHHIFVPGVGMQYVRDGVGNTVRVNPAPTPTLTPTPTPYGTPPPHGVCTSAYVNYCQRNGMQCRYNQSYRRQECYRPSSSSSNLVVPEQSKEDQSIITRILDFILPGR